MSRQQPTHRQPPLDFLSHHANNSPTLTSFIQAQLPRGHDPRIKAHAMLPCCQTVELMIERHGEDPNQSSPDGETPLMAACAWAAHEMLPATLLEHGARAGMLAVNGSSALSAAVFANCVPLVRLLLLHGEGVRAAALHHGLDALLHTLDVGLRVIAAQACNGEQRSYARYLQAIHWNRLLRRELTAWFAANDDSAAAPAASGSQVRWCYSTVLETRVGTPNLGGPAGRPNCSTTPCSLAVHAGKEACRE